MTSTTDNQTDRQLLRTFQRSRDPEVFEELVRRHHGMIYGVAKRMLGCTHAAEDVVQATFLVLAKDAAKIRKQTSLSSWLYGIAFRIAARFAKQRSKISVTPLESEVMTDTDPLEKLSQQFEHNTVFEELHALPEKNRTPMVLRYLQGKSNAEVADELNLSGSAVEGRLKRGRNQLRLRLARQGVAFTVGVAILGAIKRDAMAREMPQLVADTAQACLSVSTTAGNGELISNQAIRLAEQEMMTMFKLKAIQGTCVAVATLCLATAGWGLAGNAVAFAQGDDPFGDIADAPADNPFGGNDFATDEADPFGNAPSPKTNSFVAKAKRNTPTDDPFAASSPPRGSLADRMRRLGHFGIGSETEAEVQILEALSKPTKIEFEQETLRNVAMVISERHNIQVVIDTRALEEENIDPESDTLSLAVENIKVQSALNLLLDSLDLTTIVRDEVLMITTQTAAEEKLTTRLYKIADHWLVTEDDLVSTISSVVAPDSWEEVGGPGTIKTVPGGLFVSNRQDIHRKVSKLFSQLEKLYGPKSK